MGGRYIEVFAHASAPAHAPARSSDSIAPTSEPPGTEPPPICSASRPLVAAEAIVSSPRPSSAHTPQARPRAKSSQLGGAPAAGAAEPHSEFIFKMRGLPF